MRRLILAALVAALALPAAAQQRQAPRGDGADHPLVGRYDGAAQRLRQQRDYAEMRIVTGPVLGAHRVAGGSRAVDANSTAVAGRTLRLRYEGPDGRSPLELVRNWQQRMEREYALKREQMQAEQQLKREQAEADIELMRLKIMEEAKVKQQANEMNAAMQPERDESAEHEQAEAKNKPRKVTIKAPSGQTYTGVIE